MTYCRELREYLDALARMGKLRTISTPINKDTELHPLVHCQFRGLTKEERFGSLFERVTDRQGAEYRCRVASSVIAPSREIFAASLKIPLDEIHRR